MGDNLSVDKQTVQWLLDSENPSVRYYALKDLMDEPENSSKLERERKKVPNGPHVTALFSRQQPDGGFGVHPYTKWTGAHWRLVSLVEQGIPPGHPKAKKMTDQVLDWLASEKHRTGIVTVEGRARVHASMEGNALASCSRLGLADDSRVRSLADGLVKWQWSDGGWNCDQRPEADHSSFHESLLPLWGLMEYARATGKDGAYRISIDRACEFFLKHKLFRSCSNGKIIKEEWLKLHYPAYWHYDILQGALILSRARRIGDSRAREALDILLRRRRKDGRWQPGAYYWRRPDGGKGGRRSNREWWEPPSTDIVDWGRSGPNEMITLNALRVLKAAGRFDPI